jgi:succinate-semialdehyde dehydrogenase/glutarate-semialdehyde dehydrogenase
LLAVNRLDAYLLVKEFADRFCEDTMTTHTTDGYEKLELYIDGKWRQGSTGKSEDVINPATEEILAALPHASKEDLDEALASAQRGFEVWRKTSPNDRGKVLKAVADLMRGDADRLAKIMTLEQGKPLGEAKGEVLGTAERFEWLGEEAKRIYGKILPPTATGAIQEIVYEPVGVVVGLSPWNFPAMMPANKIGHALATGCSIIVKPAEETPGSAVAIVRLFEKAGLPKGVLNLVFGVPSEVSTHLIASPIVRKVSFTGSVPVGKHLYKLCADGMKKLTMELGGHSPVVVFDDVDVDQVATMAAGGKYRNAGQVCVSPTRFYVHDAVADKFIARFTEVARNLKVGNGLDAGVQMGPMANARRIEAMEEFVSDARDRGANITAGGKRMANQGYFWEPTVLADVPTDAKIMNLEPFGPLAPINRWSNFDDVVAQANGLPYGLAAYAFTKSQKRAGEVAEALQAGMVGVNSLMIAGHLVPFGGVKDSGIGREGGTEGLLEYMVSKTVTHQKN